MNMYSPTVWVNIPKELHLMEQLTGAFISRKQVVRNTGREKGHRVVTLTAYVKQTGEGGVKRPNKAD